MSDLNMELLGRAWKDEAFRKSLQEDPHAALAELGLDVPADVSVTVHESNDTEKHLVLPAPQGDGLSALVGCNNYGWTIACTMASEQAATTVSDCEHILWTAYCTSEDH